MSIPCDGPLEEINPINIAADLIRFKTGCSAKTESAMRRGAVAIRQLLASNMRLTAALHAAMAHPDYTYVVSAGDAGWIPGQDVMANAGYEPCPEVDVAPGDQCWRRKRDPS